MHSQNQYDIKQFFNEGKDLLNQPIKWKSSDWLKLGLIASASYGIMYFDKDISEYSLENQSIIGSIPLTFARTWGEPYAWGGISAFLFLHGSITGNSKNKAAAFEIVQAETYNILLTSFLKISFGRSRPYKNEGAFSFSPPEFLSNDNWSFPSGHTSSAFALSTVLAENSESDAAKVLWYVPALMTAISRVYENKHWASDVFAGAFLGYFTAKFLSNLHRQNENERLPSPPEQILYFSFVL